MAAGIHLGDVISNLFFSIEILYHSLSSLGRDVDIS